MAFVALPVAPDDARLRHEGFTLMDQFLTSNSNRKERDAFLSFLVDTVCKNILDSPEDEKFQRLKKSSKAFGIVKTVKLGDKLIDYLGFRGKVEDFQEFLVLRKSEPDWLEEFREKATLIKREWEKKKETDKHDSRAKDLVAEEDAKYKEALLSRIHEDRKERADRKN